MPSKKKTSRKVRVIIAPELIEAAKLDGRQAKEDRIANPLRLGVLNNEPEQQLGRRLQERREQAKLTQGELAERTKRVDRDKVGISRGVLSMYETGRNRPGPKEIRLLCEVLRTSPSYLIYGTDDPFDNLTDMGRYRGWARSDPEFYARLAYCFGRLHHHHRFAIMELMMGLLRGWNKNFDAEIEKQADDAFLKTAKALEELLAKRSSKKT
jgi:transcriptional regulator with XRE-family HTH domain